MAETSLYFPGAIRFDSLLHRLYRLFGYATGIAAFIAWSEFIAMAAHASAGFVALGAGIIAFAWREDEGTEAGALRWLPATVGVCVMTGTLMLWRSRLPRRYQISSGL